MREFNQAEINRNEISYKIDMRKANDVVRAHDAFTFTIEDGWGNASKESFEFIVTWSSISFESSRVEVCEETQDKEVIIKLKRHGDTFGSSYVNIKVDSKYADYGVDYEIANYYDESKRKQAFDIQWPSSCPNTHKLNKNS